MMVMMRDLSSLLVHHPGNGSTLICWKVSELGAELVESK